MDNDEVKKMLDEGKSLVEITRAARLAFERPIILATLEEFGWNRTKTAKRLKISYRTLMYKLVELDLKEPNAWDQLVGIITPDEGFKIGQQASAGDEDAKEIMKTYKRWHDGDENCRGSFIERVRAWRNRST